LLALLSGAWLLVGGAIGLLVYPAQRLGVVAFVLATPLEVWAAFATTLLKTQSRLGAVGLINLARALLYLAMLALVARLGLPGAYLRQVAIAVLALAAAWSVSRLRPAPRWDRDDARLLLSDGLPLLGVGFVVSVQVSIDRVLVATLLGTDALGQYSLAAVLLTVVLLLPGAVAQTSYPRMLRACGQSGDAVALRPQVLRRTGTVLVLASAAAALLGVLLPHLTRMLLPRFAAGIPAALWILPGVALHSCSLPVSNFLQAVRRQRLHLGISLAALALHVSLVRLAVALGGGIRAVSMATSLSYALYSAALFAAFLHVTRPPAAGAPAPVQSMQPGPPG
jgi:O-antigen/teichoic acid export membrane protein